jgi:cytochrome P450
VQVWGLKAVNWYLRRHHKPERPIPQNLRPIAVVLRHEDVCEVLGDHEHFSVKDFEQRMTQCSHRFLLGMGFTEEYHRDIALLRSVLRPSDREAIRKLAADHAERGVANALQSRLGPSHDTIDAVQDVVSPVLAAFLERYFGVPDVAPPAPGTVSPLLSLFLETASYIFNVELLTGPTQADAIAAGRRIKQHLDKLIGDRRAALAAGAAASDTVLDRLLGMEPDDDDRVQRILGGTVSGSIAVTFSQCLWVLDRLMDLPDDKRREVSHVARAEGADSATGRAQADQDLLDRYVREASRFKPFPPVLLRSCDGPQVIARGTRRERLLADGTIVAAATWSAAFDARVVPDPQRFHIGREDREYLLFGTGQHHCVAAQTDRPFAQVLMGQMVKAVMALPDIRRPDPGGFIDNAGTRGPQSFRLHFDAAAERAERLRRARQQPAQAA